MEVTAYLTNKQTWTLYHIVPLALCNNIPFRGEANSSLFSCRLQNIKLINQQISILCLFLTTDYYYHYYHF